MSDTNTPLTPEQHAAQKELETVLQSDDYRKGDAWTQQAAAERALEARRRLLGSENTVLLEIGPPAEAPPTIDATTLPLRHDGDTWSAPKLTALADAGKEFGVPEGELREWLGRIANGTQPPTVELAEEILRKEWGSAYAQRLAAAQRVFGRLSLVLQQELDETGLGNDPAIIRRLANLGQPMQEAEAKIAAIMANPKHPWHTGDPQALEEMQALYRIVKGTKPVLTVG